MIQIIIMSAQVGTLLFEIEKFETVEFGTESLNLKNENVKLQFKKSGK